MFVCNVRIQNLNRSIVSATDLKHTGYGLSVYYLFCFFVVVVASAGAVVILRLFFSLSTATNIYLRFDSPYFRWIVCHHYHLLLSSCLLAHTHTQSKCILILKFSLRYTYKYIYEYMVSYSYSQIVFYSNNLCLERIVTDSELLRRTHLGTVHSAPQPSHSSRFILIWF